MITKEIAIADAERNELTESARGSRGRSDRAAARRSTVMAGPSNDDRCDDEKEQSRDNAHRAGAWTTGPSRSGRELRVGPRVQAHSHGEG